MFYRVWLDSDINMGGYDREESLSEIISEFGDENTIIIAECDSDGNIVSIPHIRGIDVWDLQPVPECVRLGK